jgi:phosphate transport system permease protein
MNPIQQEKSNFTKDSLKKQFRLSEFLAEKIISSVAFLSITIIVLIFVFVFKESLPIFNFGKSDAVKTEIQADSKPESYGSIPTEDLKPETYGAEPENLKPETYGAES